MTTKDLYKRTLKDLKKKIDSKDPYEILMTAGLLRKLILDAENSLVFQIKEPNQKITFYINNKKSVFKRFEMFADDGVGGIWLIQDGLNPAKANKNLVFNPISVSLDDFSSFIVMELKGKEITVANLIRYFSHKEGAVHRQKRPLDRNEDVLLKELNDYFISSGMEGGLVILRSIAEVVYDSLSKFNSAYNIN